MRFVSRKVNLPLKRQLPVFVALTGLLIGVAMPVFAEPLPPIEEGRARMAHHDYDGALSSFGEAIGFSSENPKSYMYRGQCYFHMKRFAEALNDFNKSIGIAPDVSEVYLWRGNTYGSLNQDDNAIADYQKAMKLDPNLAKQYFAVPPEKRVAAESQPSVTMIGRRRMRGELGTDASLTPVKKPTTSHAIELYKKAMDTEYPNGLTPEIAAAPGMPFSVPAVALPVGDDPSKKPATISNPNMAIEEVTGKDKKRVLSKAKKVDDKIDQVTRDKFKKDIDQYTEALRTDNSNASSYFHRGRAHQYLQEYPQALSDFSDAIRFSPQNSQFYLARAAIYMLIKKPLMAKADVKSAQSVDPTVPAKVTLDLDPPQP